VIIEKVILENFRQYYGKQIMEFSKHPIKNVTIVHGVNGAGKTSLFLGINWCLYGESIRHNNSDESHGIIIPGEIPSKYLLTVLKEGENDHVAVEIQFSHQGDRFNVRREVRCMKMGNSLYVEYEKEKFSLMKFKYPSGAEPIPNPINTINVILPQTAGKYFLFDGERIDEFARPGHEYEIRDAIWQVIGLEALSRAKRHIDSAESRFTSIMRGYDEGDELQELLDDEKDKLEDISVKAKELVTYRKELSLAEKEKSDIDQKLSQYLRYSTYIERRKNLEVDLIEINNEANLLMNEIRLGVSRGALLLSRSIVNDITSMLDEKRKKGEIPSNIKETFLKELIERGYCICGRDIVKNSDEENRLLELIKESLPGTLEDEIIQVSIDLKSLIPKTDTLKEEVTEKLKKNIEIKDKKINIQKELDEIKEYLLNVEEQDVKLLEETRDKIERKIIDLSLMISRTEEKLRDFNEELNAIRSSIEKTKSNNSKLELAKKKKIIAEKASAAIFKLHQQFAEEKRTEIQKICEELFQKMIWKESQFQNVTITSDYKLEVVDRYGTPARYDLSAGERELLSLSFIAAMAKASGGEAPFVIDTPFGRISEEPRVNIAKYLPDMTSQLILFVTDVELTVDSENEFRTRMDKEYTLVFDDTTGISSIEVGKHV